MKATEDQEIIHELGLGINFSTLEDNDLPKKISDIAENLFANYQIAKGNTRYDFEEVEFYLYTEKHRDNNHVYPRDCQAGEWFVHYSGVDLTFQTLKEDDKITQCGGILIRRIKKVGESSVGGPLRCLMELFNGQEEPILVKKQKQEIRFETTPRIGIITDKVPDKCRYRFVQKDLEIAINNKAPKYHKAEIVIMDKKYTYNPQYEQ